MTKEQREAYKQSLIGQRFGRFVITGIADHYDTSIGLYVKVRCDCGTEKVVRLNALRIGHTLSCGKCNYKEDLLRERMTHDITGQRFGRLTAIRSTGNIHPKSSCYSWECKCDCGATVFVPTNRLLSGNTKSCGKCSYTKEMIVAKSQKYFSHAARKLARVYEGMKDRCYRKSAPNYYNYGGRGITICDEWLRDRNNFVKWGIDNGYIPDIGLTIDRIDVNGNYCPENCRWATKMTQQNNRRNNHLLTVNGETHTMSQWGRILDIPAKTLSHKASCIGGDATAIKFIEETLRVKKNNLGLTYNPTIFNIKDSEEEDDMFQLTESNSQLKPTAPSINFNTDSIFDLMTGDVRRGFDGKFYINGGFGPSVCGGLGRPGMFKSTFATSLAMRLSAIYGSQMAIFDSEDAVSRGRERILRMAGEYRDKVNDDFVLLFDAKNEYDLEGIRKAIQDIGERKRSMGEDAMITTPFVDRKTETRIKVMVPSVIIIDSYTECFSTEEATFIGDKGIDDSKAKTMFMLDANKKTLILRNLNRYAAQYGIQLIVTAHYGPKLNLDSYLPPPKMLQYGSQNESPKGVGSKFMFLTSPQFLINSCTKLQDDSKECKYKLNGKTAATDLSEIAILIQRCKNNASGTVHPFVVSQDNGLLTAASDYNYLRSQKGFSMSGNNVTHQSIFLPDVNMTRNTFRGICEKDRRLVRALQLGAQWCYVQSNWSSASWSFTMNPDPKQLIDVLMSDKNKMTLDRVLNSRGYWLPDEIASEQEYLSIFDILEFLHSTGVMKS